MTITEIGRFFPHQRWLRVTLLIIVASLIAGAWLLPNLFLGEGEPTPGSQTSTLVRLLTRRALVPYSGGFEDIELDVLYATPEYFAADTTPEAAARYSPDRYFVFLFSETIHAGALPEGGLPARLRVKGGEYMPVDAEELTWSPHHRTTVVRFPKAELGGSELPGELELLLPGGKVLRWELPITYPEGLRAKRAGFSWALLLPALAGVLAALGPCLAQLVVYYIATLTGVSMEALEDEGARAAQRWRVLRTALFFSLGFTIVYTAGGAMAGMIGRSLQSLGWLQSWNRPLSMAAGVVMLLLGWRVAVNARAPMVCRLPLASRLKSEGGTGLLGSMMTGFAFAFGCLSCFGATVLPALLLYAGATGSVLQGTLIMVIFSLGVTVPFLLAALGLGRILPLLGRLEKATPWLGLASGVVMMGFGLLMITYRFHMASSFIYKWFFT